MHLNRFRLCNAHGYILCACVPWGDRERLRFRKSYHIVAVSRNSAIFRAEQKLRMSLNMDGIVLS